MLSMRSNLYIVASLVCVRLFAAEPAPKPIEVTKVATPQPRPADAPEVPADVRDMSKAQYLADIAQVHLNYGALDRAEPLLKKALENSKDEQLTAHIHSMLAKLLHQKHKDADAVPHFEAAIKSATMPVMKAQDMVELANVYSSMKDYDKAENLFVEIMKDKTGDLRFFRMQVNRMLVDLWQKQPEKLDSVIKEAEDALAKDPKDTDAAGRLAEIYYSGRQNLPKALEYYEKLLAAKPDDADLPRIMAGLYQNTQKYDKAMEMYKKVVAASNASGQKEAARIYNFQLAQTMVLAGKKQEATALVQDTLGKDASSFADFSLLANFYEQAGMPDDAEKALVESLKKAPIAEQRADTCLRLSTIALMKKDFDKAEAQLKAAEKENVTNQYLKSRIDSINLQITAMRLKPAPILRPPAIKPPAVNPPPEKKEQK